MSQSKPSGGTKKRRRALVTGASGFLGLHLVRELTASKMLVRSLGRHRSVALDHLGVEQICGSVLDMEACHASLADIDCVYHLAGMVSRSPKKASEMYSLHVQGLRNVLEACQAAKVNDVLVVSTSGTIGVSTDPEFRGDESSSIPWSLIGRWPYYESKAFAEKEILRFVTQGLPVRMARPSLLLGPGDVHGGSTHDVVRFLCGEIPAALPGGINFVDVRDVASVLPTILAQGQPGIGYILGGVNCSVREFLVGLEQVSGVAAPKLSIPNWWVHRGPFLLETLSRLGGLDSQTFEMGCHYWYLDSGRAQAEFDFRPRDWLSTLADTVEDIRNIGRCVPRMPVGS